MGLDDVLSRLAARQQLLVEGVVQRLRMLQLKQLQHVNFCGLQALLGGVCVYGLACLFTQLINNSINLHSSEHGAIM